jgi:hypothetical protein
VQKTGRHVDLPSACSGKTRVFVAAPKLSLTPFRFGFTQFNYFFGRSQIVPDTFFSGTFVARAAK